jgi:hypothetical protein
MKALLWATLFLAANAFADEAAERAAIGRVILGLNDSSQRRFLTGNAEAEFERLRRAHPLAFRIIGPAVGDRPTVTISHEPWGEATIDLSGRPSIVFITADVALAEGACAYEDHPGTQETTPLLFVMKKEGDDWKIAAIRVLAR